VSLEHKPLDKMSQRDLLGHSFEELAAFSHEGQAE
jgi:hypothetical protein